MLFKVLGNIRHNGTDYQKDDTLDIDEATGMVLVEDGVLEVIEKQPESTFRPDAEDESKDESSETAEPPAKKDDDKDEKILEKILKKEPDKLSRKEITILKGAKELSEEDREKFASVLE